MQAKEELELSKKRHQNVKQFSFFAFHGLKSIATLSGFSFFWLSSSVIFNRALPVGKAGLGSRRRRFVLEAKVKISATAEQARPPFRSRVIVPLFFLVFFFFSLMLSLFHT